MKRRKKILIAVLSFIELFIFNLGILIFSLFNDAGGVGDSVMPSANDTSKYEVWGPYIFSIIAIAFLVWIVKKPNQKIDNAFLLVPKILGLILLVAFFLTIAFLKYSV